MAARLYTLDTLSRHQGGTASCAFLAVKIVHYLLTSPTPSLRALDQIIVEGVHEYDIYMERHRATVEMHSTVDVDPQTGVSTTNNRFYSKRYPADASGYCTAAAAFRFLSEERGTVAGVVNAEDFMGLNIDRDMDQSVVPAPMLDKTFGFELSLQAGIERFFEAVAKAPEGETVAAALATVGHVVAFSATIMPGGRARYHAVETLASAVGHANTTHGAAVLVTSDLDLGLRAYLAQAFPPHRDVEDVREVLATMEMDGPAAHYYYSMSLFRLAPTAVHTVVVPQTGDVLMQAVDT